MSSLKRQPVYKTNAYFEILYVYLWYGNHIYVHSNLGSKFMSHDKNYFKVS